MESSDPFTLRGKRVLLTGASGYLGQAMARGLAHAGASVVVSSRTLATAQSIADELPVVGQAVHGAVQIDHLDATSIDTGFLAAVEAAGTIDVLVANGHEPLAADWKNVSAEQFNRQLENATGYFLLARCLRNHLVERQASGSVVMLGSMYGLVGSYPDAYENVDVASPVAYHALKGGVLQMVRHLAVYWAEDRIRVNALSPGPFPSPNVSSEMVEKLTAKSPMRRMGKPDELIGPLVFLASDASSYVTGHNLVVDGGWTAW
ncbi:SDR family NAD(P)-dependent oxidoreductase [Blastopirellula marina]|uniref:Short-chain dehydrogenase n=1 Tax=Blastopirellula marina TaxID=124 RepID=A0A2S8GDH9_9BACT|nr:SDR family oxidoreductase [Blastopirellula marina]PQO42301.1 short-chain dehydrogenase [Blastopirellula marina]